MATKMSWESKLVAWEMGWVKREPMERIRFAAGVGAREENPSWRTMREVMTEFLLLDDGQAQLLTEPLRDTWRRWRTHIESLRECAESLKGVLVFEETEISGSTIFIPIFPTSFGVDDASEGDHKKGPLNWVIRGDNVDVFFSLERQPSYEQLTTHFLDNGPWTFFEELKERLRDAIKDAGSENRSVAGVQPLTVKIVEGLAALVYCPPKMKRCDHCPDSAPGVFPLQRSKSTD